MKKIYVYIVAFILIVSPITTEANDICPPQTAAKAAIVMDQQSGRILYEKNINEKLPMASTTKL